MAKTHSLSKIQKFIWIDQHINPDSNKYNIGGYSILGSGIVFSLFREAIYKVALQHSILRSRIVVDQFSEPCFCQSEIPEESLLEFKDMSDLPHAEEEARKWMDAEMQVPVDLLNGQLFHFCLLKTNKGWYWYVKFHHIINDGYGLSLFFKAVLNTYACGALTSQDTIYDYDRFVSYEAGLSGTSSYERSKLFWISKYNDIDYPADDIRAIKLDHKAESYSSLVDARLVQDMTRFNEACGYSFLHLFLAAFSYYWSNIYSSHEIDLITAVQNRVNKGFKNTIGPFVNLMPVHLSFDSSISVIDCLEAIKAEFKNCLRNQQYQLGELISDLGSASFVKTLKNIRISYEKHDYGFVLNGIPIEVKAIPNHFEDASLSIHIREYNYVEKEVVIDFDYNPEVYTTAEIAAFSRTVPVLMGQFICGKHFADIELVNSEEEQQALNFSGKSTSVSYTGSVLESIRNSFATYASSPAFVFSGYSQTFEELNKYSACIANALNKNYKVTTRDKVGLFLKDKSLYMASLLGIIRARGTYVPMDPSYPSSRIHNILEASGCRFIICSNISDVIAFESMGYRALLAGTLILDEVIEDITELQAEDSIYVICTSGSTGLPKAAQCYNYSFNNLVKWYVDKLKLTPADSTLILSSIGFDLTQKNLFASLFAGCTIYMADMGIYDPVAILELIHTKKITWINCTPSAFYALLECDETNSYTNLASLKNVVLGGEPIQMNRISKWYDSDMCQAKLINSYGPTECTDVTNTFDIPRREDYLNKTVPIGKPLPNINTYILNEEAALIPLGVIGEICVGGVAVGSGYLNDPVKTAEKFIADPFVSGGRLYRTGDLGRWLADGNIEFLGRRDNQVKIRGYRIETGEIEQVMLGCLGVEGSVVTVSGPTVANRQLYGYYLGSATVQELRGYLVGQLPEYMVPAFLVQMDSFPLTGNGKINRAALPLPVPEGEGSHTPPADEVEISMAGLWGAVLGINSAHISRDSNFFELGGHSLSATLLASRIHRQFNTRIALADIFRRPLLYQMGQAIKAVIAAESFESIPRVAHSSSYVLSSSQRRLWILSKFDPDSTAYNLPAILEMTGKIDIVKLESSICRLIERHEILRTNFREYDNKIVQIINDKVDFSLEFYRSEDLTEEEWQKTFVRSFDLGEDILLRVGIYFTNNGNHLLAFDMHHIITDGISQDIFINELLSVYQGDFLPAPELQYKDYAEWQQSQEYQSRLQGQEEFWLKKFSKDVDVLELPYDYPRPAIKSYQGSNVSLHIDSEMTARIQTLANAENCTVFMIMLTAYHVLLSKLSGRQNVFIGIPVSGRRHAEIETMLGMFVNTLVLSGHIERSKTFRKFLSDVRKDSLEAFDNQDYQYEQLVEKLSLKRDTGRNPLFDVMFNYQLLKDKPINAGNNIFKGVDYEQEISKFDLNLHCVDQNNQLLLSMEYNTSLFNKEKVIGFIKYYQNILKQIISDPERLLGELDIFETNELELSQDDWMSNF